jgi:hypothetical protein
VNFFISRATFGAQHANVRKTIVAWPPRPLRSAFSFHHLIGLSALSARRGDRRAPACHGSTKRRLPTSLPPRPPRSFCPILPAGEHMAKIAMRHWRSLIGICRPGPIWLDVVFPYASARAPPPRNVVSRKITGGVSHPKQSQKNKELLQTQLLHSRAFFLPKRDIGSSLDKTI